MQTICQRLQTAESGAAQPGSAGGSTYGFDIWPGHPLEAEVMGLLASLRTRCGELRTRVEEHNESCTRPGTFREVVAYLGQCSFERGLDEDQHEDE